MFLWKCAARTIKYLLNRLFGCDSDRACLSASDIKHIIHIKIVWNKSRRWGDAERRIGLIYNIYTNIYCIYNYSLDDD